MCTLTWRVADEGGYDLFFNRDELHARAPEGPPWPRRTDDGVSFVAPEDGDRGGSWLVLNAHGVTVCLLNYYPRGIAETGNQTRGRLPLICAECANTREVAGVLRDRRLEAFAPFHLVAVDAAGEGVQLRWDGRALHEASAPGFLTSSSFDSERVQRARGIRFAELPGRTTEALATFHHQHDPESGAESVCMRRADACTRSVCAVRVRAGERELAYEAVVWGKLAVAMPVVVVRP